MMKKEEPKKSGKTILWTILGVLFVLFIVMPLTFSLFDRSAFGNVALIPITGVITADGEGYFGKSTVSSQAIVDFIQKAEDNSRVKVILLEINSPGGSAVASDEIAGAVKAAKKPVIALIREVGASGGYWVASATDHIIANRMSITGSIGVISSYLEFSGLMEKYGVNYERLVAGEHKDIGTPYRPLDEQERQILQGKLDKIHEFFIEEIVANRGMKKTDVQKLATGEFYVGSEALENGLIDQLGDTKTAEEYITQTYGLKKVEYVEYKETPGLFDLFSKVSSQFSFSMGQGLGSTLLEKEDKLTMMLR